MFPVNKQNQDNDTESTHKNLFCEMPEDISASTSSIIENNHDCCTKKLTCS